MAPLIAVIGSGKGTWNNVASIIKLTDWDKVILITNKFGRENFPKRFPGINPEFIVIDEEQDIREIASMISEKLKPLLSHELDIALNIESGTGKIHTAILAALMGLGLSFRLVGVSNDSLIEITTSPYSLTEQ